MSGLECYYVPLPGQNVVRVPDEYAVYYQTSVTYTCHGGFQYPNGETTMVMICEADGKMSGTAEDCAGIYCVITCI